MIGRTSGALRGLGGVVLYGGKEKSEGREARLGLGVTSLLLIGASSACVHPRMQLNKV